MSRTAETLLENLQAEDYNGVDKDTLQRQVSHIGSATSNVELLEKIQNTARKQGFDVERLGIDIAYLKYDASHS